MTFALSQKSLDKLTGVHPDLIKVVQKAITITTVDFTVLEGLRTLERQRLMVAEKNSQTMASRHLNGFAVDLGAIVNGTINWEPKYYLQINEAMQQASKNLNVVLIYGGDWHTLKDYDHWELAKES